MTDFHTHILPGIDDGAKDVNMSLEMLRAQQKQGVTRIFLTPHFYPNEQSLEDFLKDRENAFRELKKYISVFAEQELLSIDLRLGAEVYYFPGISDARLLKKVAMEGAEAILVEPPMEHFKDDMLDDIESIYGNLGLIPVIAHVDRYCRVIGDYSFFDALEGRKIMAQCNTSFFVNVKTGDEAFRYLKEGRIHLLGSDCHNLENRVPNFGYALNAAKTRGMEKEFIKVAG